MTILDGEPFDRTEDEIEIDLRKQFIARLKREDFFSLDVLTGGNSRSGLQYRRLSSVEMARKIFGEEEA